MSKSMYDIIKKQNGEAFARTIRDYDSGIFEVPNLPRILKYAGHSVIDAYDLAPYLASLKPCLKKEKKPLSMGEDLFELADKAGYQVFYADTLEKQNSIRHLFCKGEELCTFRDEKRFQNYYILHFVKKGAEKLNRQDFKGKEKREDAYGASVLSIQIDKRGGNLKICNRYNHTVESPDNTFRSNPDNIIDGLTLAIEKFLDCRVETECIDVPNGYLNLGGCLYKYHLESENVVFGNDFYVKDNEIYFINKDYQMIIDTFLVDFKENKIKPLHDMSEADQRIVYFHSTFNHVPLIIKEVEQGGRLSRTKEGDKDVVLLDGRPILKSKQGQITYLHLTTPVKCNTGLFSYHESIEEIYFDNLEELSDTVNFYACVNLKVLSLPKLKVLERESVSHLSMLEQLDLKSVEKVGSNCLNYLGRIAHIELPKLKELKSFTLSKNNFLQSVKLEKLKELKEQSISYNALLVDVVLSQNVKEIHETALKHNPFLPQSKMPRKIGKQSAIISSNKNKGRAYE